MSGTGTANTSNVAEGEPALETTSKSVTTEDLQRLLNTLNQHAGAIDGINQQLGYSQLISPQPVRIMRTKEKVLFGALTALVLFSFVLLYQNSALNSQVTGLQKTVQTIEKNTTPTPIKSWVVWPWNWF
jgi:hypothetical protein